MEGTRERVRVLVGPHAERSTALHLYGPGLWGARGDEPGGGRGRGGAPPAAGRAETGRRLGGVRGRALHAIHSFDSVCIKLKD